MRIHREGTATLIIGALVLATLNGLIAWLWHDAVVVSAALSAGIYALLLNFFRNPPRSTRAQPGEVIAPCDGRVVQIISVQEEEYFREQRLLVSIFMSPLNVHVNRCPVEGIVVYCRYHPGRYLVAWHPKSSVLNERTTVVIQSTAGKVLFRQIAGVLARRIVCYLREGDTVTAGQEMGFIKFGSRLDVFLPPSAAVTVKTGDKVRGGETLLAHLPDFPSKTTSH